jgi:hypothetical protein
MFVHQITLNAKTQRKLNGRFRQTELCATQYNMCFKLFTNKGRAAYAINKRYSVTDTLFVHFEVIHGIKSREY